MNAREAIWKRIAEVLDELGAENSRGAVGLEHTSDFSHGDYSSNAALALAKEFGAKPQELAKEIVEKMGKIDGVSRVEIADPGFINFHLAPSALADTLSKAANEDQWGANADLKDKKIMVEYTDPNPFKEFHIGHLMSNAIGETISRLLQFSGAEVKRANYQGDVGPHVAKTIWNLQASGLNIDSIRDAGPLGHAYIEGAKAYENNPIAKEEIDAINAKVYDRTDQVINNIYDKGREVSLGHFEALYKILGTKFDLYFFESDTAPKGLALVKAHPEVFTESDGAIVYKGEQDGLHTRVFITSKGLPTYETKDLGLAELKSETWDFDMSITVTAQEQADYFAVMLAAMKKVLPQIAPKIQHISHGVMRLTTGKMSSRTGDVITGESLLNDLTQQAKIRAAESRADDKEKLAQDVAVAAIKYQILKQASGKDIIFDRERALSLEGDSGPYLQYAHARTRAILEKAKEQGVEPQHQGEPLMLSELARLLYRFPEIIERAAAEYEPHLVTNYLLQVAADFNSWYAQEQILDGTPAAAHKVALTAAVARTLKNGLWILGIPAPEKM